MGKDDLWGLLYILNGGLHPDLRSRLRNGITDLARDLQVLSNMAEPGSVPISAPTPPATEPNAKPPADAKTQAPMRRRASKTFDFVLLEGIKQGRIWRPIIGQDELYDLAKVLDDRAKKDSLVSKLNRWKNAKRWIAWADPTDLHLTKDGEARRNDLLTYVKSQGHEDQVKNAFKTAWNYDMTPS
ncbi:MAG: hypothetical protein AAFQ59_00925 [Pseudomonadota bacterium]